jgi:transcriptional regulator with XRE-family HTH domain
MVNISNIRRKSARDIAYYAQRYKNRVFSKLVSFIAEQCEAQGLTKKELAEAIGKDAGLVSRWLSQPSNLTLDTISELALAVNAEAEPPEFILFADRRQSNHVHPLIARVTNIKREVPETRAFSVGMTTARIPVIQSGVYRSRITVSSAG